MNPYYQNNLVTLYHGDCRDILPEISGVSAVLTDPPYGLSFMGKGWDKGVPGPEFWELIINTCIPGANLISFGGCRTYHRLACAIEDAGWQINNMGGWLFGSGFPKGADVSRHIDKAAGVKRQIKPVRQSHEECSFIEYPITEPGTDSAKKWDGWKYGKQSLKPAIEPFVLAQKAFESNSGYKNALEYGVCGLNIDACRVDTEDLIPLYYNTRGKSSSIFGTALKQRTYPGEFSDKGRFPANIIHDGSTPVMDIFPETKKGKSTVSASRFFYCAKASQTERGGINKHPTVKPLKLMEYLVKLISMPDVNLLLDPFAGSGTTGVAAMRLEKPCILIEKESEYCEVIKKRLENEATLWHQAM